MTTTVRLDGLKEKSYFEFNIHGLDKSYQNEPSRECHEYVTYTQSRMAASPLYEPTVMELRRRWKDCPHTHYACATCVRPILLLHQPTRKS